MYEDVRQQYLSSLGIDTYIPRWVLPNAPASYLACFSPLEDTFPQSVALEHSELVSKPQNDTSPILVGTLIESLNPELTPTTNKAVNAASILAQLDVPKPKRLAPFGLSIWRLSNRLLVIDARNPKAALPTEALLKNLLSFVRIENDELQEDILQWPMIENRFSSQTADEARQELQTWLSVQLEIHGFQSVWLMGENAYQYFFDEKNKPAEFSITSFPLSDRQITIFPSLVELLANPICKRQLLSVLKPFSV